MKVLALILAFAVASAMAQDTPTLLPFQARLTDAGGAPVTNGVRLVQFLIYSQPTGGTPVWAGEVHRTTVNGGLVNVILGTKTPFTGVDFSQQLYLETTVDVNGDNQITPLDPPMLPRQIILPAIFAKESAVSRDSSTLNGADWRAILATGSDPRDTNAFLNAAKLQPGSLTGAQFAPGSITTTNIAAGSVVATNLASASVGLAALKQEIINALVPPGTIMAWAGPKGSIPAGWLMCDGSPVNQTDYPTLYSAIGTSWGYGGPFGTTFRLPDLRGYFLRGVSAGTGRDPDAPTRFSLYGDGGNYGDNVGSYQASAFASHNHYVSAKNGANLPGSVLGVNVPGSQNPGWNNLGFYFGQVDTLDLESSNTGGAETRPVNAGVYYIIKY